MKNQRKICWKWWGLRGKIIENILFFICFREFTLFRKTSKKRCPNGSRNWQKMEQTQPLGTPRVDLFIIFMDFGWCRKIVVFWCRPRASKNQQKSSFGEPRGHQGDFDPSPGIVQQRREAPATASRVFFGLKNSSKRAQQPVLTRPRAQGPANFINSPGLVP